jgi:hypothetical protein
LVLYPTIGAAIVARVPSLSFSCPACGQVGAVDLRTPALLAQRTLRKVRDADKGAAVTGAKFGTRTFSQANFAFIY